MIELPEAVIISRQMNQELRGKRVQSGLRGNSPHKFAFYSRSPEEYEAILKDKIVGESVDHGSAILTSMEPDYVLVLGGGGERILLHQNDETLPKKHHLLLRFQDGAYLSVKVQGWGNALLMHKSEATNHPHVGEARVSPLGEAFTYEYFQQLFEELDEQDPRSVKFFIISKPGIWGVGNGYLQDILFRAKIHPKRKVIDITEDESRALFGSIKETLKQAVDLGGRESERDLFNRPGRYEAILSSKTVGQPCPECGTPFEKIHFLGGACYFCTCCQT
jgi:formamidopyrimidine-DNA glycosylase